MTLETGIGSSASMAAYLMRPSFRPKFTLFRPTCTRQSQCSTSVLLCFSLLHCLCVSMKLLVSCLPPLASGII